MRSVALILSGETVLKLKHVVLATLVVVAPATALADPIRVEGVQMSRDFPRDGQDVIVDGLRNTVALTGRCGDVKVIGLAHKVTFGEAKSLLVSGSEIEAAGGETGNLVVEVANNAVEAKIKSEGEPAKVVVSGVDQNVVLTVAGTAKIEVMGSKNELSWKAENGVKEPAISMSGIDNKVVSKR